MGSEGEKVRDFITFLVQMFVEFVANIANEKFIVTLAKNLVSIRWGRSCRSPCCDGNATQS